VLSREASASVDPSCIKSVRQNEIYASPSASIDSMARLTSALVLVALPLLASAQTTACYFGAQQQIIQPAAGTNITLQVRPLIIMPP
jgi:hypothetical protein